MRIWTRTAVEVVAMWAVTTGGALVFAWQTRVGPSLPLTGRHGIHTGDIVVLCSLWFVATAFSWHRIRATRDERRARLEVEALSSISRPSPPSGAR
jgi:hypothetical protein